MNISILDLLIDTSYGSGGGGKFRNFWNVVFGVRDILGNGFRHFHLNTIKRNKVKISTSLKQKCICDDDLCGT